MDSSQILLWQGMIATFSATYVTPVATELCKRWSFGERFSASISAIGNVVLFLLAWLALDRDRANLPLWLWAGLGTGGAANAYNQASKTTKLPDFTEKLEVPTASSNPKG